MEARSHCGRQWKNNPESSSSQQELPLPFTCPEYSGPAGRVNSKESCLSLWDLGLCCPVLPHRGLCSLHSSTVLFGCPSCSSMSWFGTMVAPPLWRTRAANFGSVHTLSCPHLCQCASVGCGDMAVSTYVPKAALTPVRTVGPRPILQEAEPRHQLLQGWGYWAKAPPGWCSVVPRGWSYSSSPAECSANPGYLSHKAPTRESSWVRPL